jgi:hypothetical protein
MVNHAWDNFENWIDDAVEMIPPHEQNARKKVMEAVENLSAASKEKEVTEQTINVEIREKNVEINLLKTELRKTKEADNERKQDLQTRIAHKSQ